jgi:hypothetical protein
MYFRDWYAELCVLASKHGVSVVDQNAWRECFDKEQTPQEAFYEEYPELL